MPTITDFLNPITDGLHITDSKSAERAYDALNKGNAKAITQLTGDIQPSIDMLQDAAKGRSLKNNLDQYDIENALAQKQTATAAGDIWGAQDAGSRTGDFVNPFADQMESTAVNKMQGTMGSSLQSSGAQRKMADALNEMGDQMWDTAFQQALGDSQNRVDAAGTSAKMANQYGQMADLKLDANNQPALDLLNLNNDLAMQNYAGNIALTQANTQLQGQNRSFL